MNQGAIPEVWSTQMRGEAIPSHSGAAAMNQGAIPRSLVNPNEGGSNTESQWRSRYESRRNPPKFGQPK
ncbi:hypothetical protein A6J66_009390 [Yersinia enterocolitica]|nr:hypothetical protein A6J66_009390 [Yersinia enterocolitica]